MDPQLIPPSAISETVQPGRLRRANVDDVAAILRLREVMFTGMHGPDADRRVWSEQTADWFHAGLSGDPAAFAAFLIDEPERGVVSVAAGRAVPWLPGPRNPAGLRGHVFNVATDADRRRRGYARRCMEALLAWFRDDTAVTRVELNASAEGLELYRSLGFVLPSETPLRLSLDR